MDLFLIIDADEEIMEEENRYLRLCRRFIRDAINPFEISHTDFKRLYRFSQVGAMELIRILMPFLNDSNRAGSLAPHFQVLAALNYFASGSYQRRVGQDFLSCMSQSSVSVILHRVVNALNEVMDDWIKFPTSVEEIQAVKTRFWQEHQFPGVIGLIDGTHIPIAILESEQQHLFFNRKKFHSLNTLLVCDADRRILYVNAGHGGRTHDTRVFLASMLSYHLQVEHQNGHRNLWLLGDSGYPLLPYLLTPKLNQAEGTPGWNYTRHHMSVRSKVERMIRLLKALWRCLGLERVMHYYPQFAGQIINSCCVLHNMMIAWKMDVLNEVDVDYDGIDDNDFQAFLDDFDVGDGDAGIAVREALINNYYGP